jgi:peptidoglycan/LPS O-acetylase OafA/YrhL
VLRGLSAMVVAVGHMTVLYLQAPELIGAHISAEPAALVRLPGWFNSLYNLFDLASIGVAVFFLISGFVIALSLESADTLTYLARRFLRVYPTYLVAFALSLAAVYISAIYWARPLSFGAGDVFANAFLLSDAFSSWPILPPAWTLLIEIKFYALAPLFMASLSRGSVLRLHVWAVAVAFCYWLATARCNADLEACWSHYRYGFRLVAREAMFITYMLIGSVFYAHYRGLLDRNQAIASILFLFACFWISETVSPIPALAAAHYVVPLFWGLLIFAASYHYRDRFQLTPIFKFMADISYPLYVVHLLVGTVALRLLGAAGLPFIPAFGLALALVIFISLGIHNFIEAPSIAYGKSLHLGRFRIEGRDAVKRISRWPAARRIL